MTPSERSQLFDALSELPSQDLDKLLFELNPPRKNIPGSAAPPGDRVKALLDWADSYIGCGLEEVCSAFDRLKHSRPTVASETESYLRGISRRYEKWRQDNALTNTIAAQQATFTFEQFVQTEDKQPEEQSQKKTLPLFKGIRDYFGSEHILLVGSPGVGKSSALWHCLDMFAKEELASSQPRIPVLVQLKGYRDSFVSSEDPSGLLALIQVWIKPYLRLSISEIYDLLCQKQLILLIDGLNEMPAGAFRTHLKSFREECEELEIPLICSTRELGGGDLGIQRKLEIQPLSSQETERFLKECLLDHQDQVRQLLQRDNRELSRTPFVLWMLYHLLKETGTIAETLGEAFRQFFRFHLSKYKEDAPVTEEHRKAWNLWLEELAFEMLGSSDPLNPGLVITREEAEKTLAKRFGELQDNSFRISELEKYHFLELVSDRSISFQHQLIQEYYAAERFLEKLQKEKNLFQNNENQNYTPFQASYINYLKWTEPLLIAMSLLDSPTTTISDPVATAIQITQLALSTDLRLGSRCVGAASKTLQKELVKLLLVRDCQDSLKIWLLQQSQSSEAVSYLLHILQNGDSNHRWRAARALAKFKIILVKDHLINSLEDEEASVRRIAAASLKELYDDSILPHLCRLLDDEDFLVRSFVVDYIGDIKEEESTKCLENALVHSDSTVRKKAAEYLGRRDPQKVICILDEKLQEGSESRRIAINLLGETRSRLAFPSLLKTLSDEDWIIRSNATDSIGLLSIHLGMSLPEDVASKLVDILLNDVQATVRSGAAIYLGFSKNIIALPSLIEALSEDKNMVVRRSAACALGKIGSLTAENILIEHLRDEEMVVEETIRTLRLLRSSKALPHIRRFLKSKNSKLRKEAVLSIGVLGDPKIDLAILYKFLKDKNFSVRLCAAYALSQLGNRKGIPILKEALETGNKDARRRALYGLQNFNGEVELFAISSIAIKDEEYSLRKEATDFLGSFSHTQEVRGYLEKTLMSNDETIARQAMDAAKVLGCPEILKILNRIVEGILAIERPLEAIQTIQLRCGFYNHEIVQSGPESIESQSSFTSNQTFNFYDRVGIVNTGSVTNNGDQKGFG